MEMNYLETQELKDRHKGGTWSLSILCNYDAWKNRKCKPYVIRTMRVRASSLAEARRKTFIGSTECFGICSLA